MYVLGVDPGLKGALCLMKDNTIVSILPMPTIKEGKGSFIDIKKISEWVKGLLLCYKIDTVFIEKQIVISSQGLSSSGKTMYQFGLLVGLFEGLNLNLTIVTAKEWQKTIFKSVDKSIIKEYNYPETKLYSIGFVEQRYDESYLFTSNRQKKPNDGIADSICIAAFGFFLQSN